MSYIVQRQDRFYVVAYDGLDPLTGHERRRWHPVGHDRGEAEQLAARLDYERDTAPPAPTGPVTFGEFLTHTWIPHKRRQVRATTAYRYAWFVDRYIQPTIGDVPLRRLRADHLDSLYDTLATTGGRTGNGLAPKTVLEVHAVIRAALDHAVARRLVDCNVAHHTRSRQRPPASGAARSWTADELATFLTAARGQRLYPALHLAAHTGMRRGEIVGLRADGDPVPPPADGTCPFRPGRRAQVSPVLEPTVVAESVGHLPKPRPQHPDRPARRQAPRLTRATGGAGQAQLDFTTTTHDIAEADSGLVRNRVAGSCERCGVRLTVGAGTVATFGAREVIHCHPACPPTPTGT